MIELRLHNELYASGAIDDAVERFAPFGAIEQLDEAPYRVLRVRAASPERERAIAGELANFALGNSIGARPEPPGSAPRGSTPPDEASRPGGEP